jgi:uncharacterized protein YkwD
MVVRRLSVLLALLALAVTAVPVVGAGQSNAQRLTGVESQIVREINRVRAAAGLRPLTVSPTLRTVAFGHSRTMLQGGFFDHTSPDGTSATERIGRTYRERPNRTWAVGEVLYSTSGGMTAREAVTRWLASPGHRGILLSAQWREVGIGVARSPLAGGAFHNLPAVVATADFGAR